ncbi:hypothetical protein Q9R08_04885 [Microbacterium sp. QXD-8]|uniref:Uncharacterized protein n=1 Tax=Microbacterium psychrotolerans TaxID=3068321 RepID=A0ABU0YY89_9MICO|nr:hypothetical protein [Microbacterium sp. QXD-8]MDQ7877307.1 hypothetical protein [Microbacterium sp. QXD-8]
MNTCPHGIDSSYDLCEQCLASVADGDAVLGRFGLVGPGAGLAVDLKNGRVTVYMVQADTVVSGGGGIADGWVTFDEQATNAPDVELHPPVELEGASTRDLADLCEVVSELATSLLPMLEELVDSDATSDEIVGALAAWVNGMEIKPLTRRILWSTLKVLAAAVLAYMEREDEDES